MEQNNIEIAVKNMVCNRCIKVVKEELTKNNIDFLHVDLGKIDISKPLSVKESKKLKQILKDEGFELVEDKEAIIVTKVKALVIKYIHQGKKIPQNQNFSNYLTSNIGIEYSYISKLFSEIEDNTIEHYIIEQRIERAKEFIIYNELTLSQISYDLNYSSPQHLSKQFKQIVGITPTQFKLTKTRKYLDNI